MRILIIALCLGYTGAQAATVQFNGSRAVGVQGIQVDGSYYDVHFEYESYVSIWGFEAAPFASTCTIPNTPENLHPCGPGDSSDALAATDAINTALNSSGVILIQATDGSIHNFFAVAYLFDGCADSYVRSAYADSSWSNQGDGFNDCFPNVRPYAVFTNSAVPLPPAVWLFASGIAALLLRRRRR